MTRILITGASSGLGEGLALAYAEPGAVVGLVARREELLLEVAEKVRARGATASVHVADVRDTEAMDRVASAFAEEAGGIDICIANAGIGEGRKTARFDARKVARVFEVNLVGVANTLLPVAAIMRKQGSGTLVGMSSVAGYRAIPGSLAYSASKAGVMTLMEGLLMELSVDGVHAMTLCPGFIRTPLTDKNDFNMPFMVELEEACSRMKRAIAKKKSRYTFPFPMAVAAFFLRISPRWILLRVSPKRPKKLKQA